MNFSTAHCLLNRLVLDLERLNNLRELARLAGDPHPVAHAEIPVSRMYHRDPDPVEVVGHDSDLLFHGCHSRRARKHKRPRWPREWSRKASMTLSGDPVDEHGRPPGGLDDQ